MTRLSDFAIAPAGAGHIAVLAALHADAFAEGWGAEEFAGLLAMPGTAAAIATEGDGVPAGMIVWRHAAVEAEVLTIAVRPDCRRAGAGRALLEAAIAALPAPVAEIFVEVAEPNAAARALYAAAGFETVGRRPAYYRTATGRDDALIMRRQVR